MKEITMFTSASCPHCKNAERMTEALLAKHPEYRDIKIKRVDENKEPEYAAKFDYYYIPTFYVDDVKMHEGVPTEQAIEKVFSEASK